MKKLFALFIVAGTMSVIACGPSQEEKDKAAAAAEKIKMDSIMQANAMPEAEATPEMPAETTAVATPEAAPAH